MRVRSAPVSMRASPETRPAFVFAVNGFVILPMVDLYSMHSEDLQLVHVRLPRDVYLRVKLHAVVTGKSIQQVMADGLLKGIPKPPVDLMRGRSYFRSDRKS